jgi:hypothetical protein
MQDFRKEGDGRMLGRGVFWVLFSCLGVGDSLSWFQIRGRDTRLRSCGGR